MTQMLNVLLIGPEPQAKGGIATVIRGMLDSDDLTKFVNLKMWLKDRLAFSLSHSTDCRKDCRHRLTDPGRSLDKNLRLF